jgi:hypothetical protein
MMAKRAPLRLFFATIPIVRYAHIAVAATDAASALEYLATDKEWQEDNTIMYADGAEFLAPKLTQITDPSQVLQFEMDDMNDLTGNECCWGPGPDVCDTTIGMAFFDDVLTAEEPEPDEELDDLVHDERWTKFFQLEKEKSAEFVRLLAEARQRKGK